MSSQPKSNAGKLSFRTQHQTAFSAEAKKHKLSQTQFFDRVWQVYKSKEKPGAIEPQPLSLEMLAIAPEDRTLIEDALKLSGLPLQELLQIALTREARAILQQGIQLPDPPEELPMMRKRIWIKINEVMHWNSYCRVSDRVYVSPSLLKRYHPTDYNALKEILALRKEELDLHHKHFSISEDANRKGTDLQGNWIDVAKLIGSYPPPGQVKEESTVISQPSVAVEQPAPVEVAEEIPEGRLTPKEYFELLKDEPNPTKHEKEAIALLKTLRAELDVRVVVYGRGLLRNEGQGEPGKLDTKLESYRKLFRGYPLTPATTSYRHLKNARLPSSYPGGNPPAGCRLNDDGLVVAEPRHLAISYLCLSDIENAFMNLSRDAEQFAEQYPQYSLG